MADKIHDLVEFDTVTLGDIRFPETEFCVETLIPAGICVLGGAPKVGKSWLALDLCMKVAKGERFWNQRTRQGRRCTSRWRIGSNACSPACTRSRMR